ncbi:hypothetical protein B9479_006648 [Cryptococcus floricola]|uniref:Uncharacterized protein n=1 Tax=Cryptococcus floricola TaxID=2591691 RepID=A0A5D3ARP6_9TREE|nr:hypothetical protein B9479_006648 [Cryptococcus floricola]
MPTSPSETSPPCPDITTLSPLPSEIISVIYSHYLAQKPLESRSRFLNLLTFFREIYEENAWRMYEVVELDDRNYELPTVFASYHPEAVLERFRYWHKLDTGDAETIELVVRDDHPLPASPHQPPFSPHLAVFADHA